MFEEQDVASSNLVEPTDPRRQYSIWWRLCQQGALANVPQMSRKCPANVSIMGVWFRVWLRSHPYNPLGWERWSSAVQIRSRPLCYTNAISAEKYFETQNHAQYAEAKQTRFRFLGGIGYALDCKSRMMGVRVTQEPLWKSD